MITIHPLLRSASRTWLSTTDDPSARDLLRRCIVALLNRDQWSDAFALVREFDERILFQTLLTSGLDCMIGSGDLSEVSSWIEYAHTSPVETPYLVLAEAEVCLRTGKHRRAELMASALVEMTSAPDELRARAWNIAGRGAHLRDDDIVSLAHHRNAEAWAENVEDIGSSLWGQCISLTQLEDPEAALVLDRTAQITPREPDDALRVLVGRYLLATRGGTVSDLLSLFETGETLLTLANDPLRRTSFLDTHARLLVITGNYEAAIVAHRAITEGQAHALRFVAPSGLASLAMAHVGLRRFTKAAQLIAACETAARKVHDDHNLCEAATTRLRLLLVQGRGDQALALAEPDYSELPSRSMLGEYHAARALAWAVAGHRQHAIAEIEEANAMSNAIEATVLVAGTRAIVELAAGGDSQDSAMKFSDIIERSGSIDGLVTSYRAYPPLLDFLMSSPRLRPLLERTLPKVRDFSLAAEFGLYNHERRSRERGDPLSKRENEVFELLAQGQTNREIARALFIAEITVKVHVRHIFAKLGVRNRTEAATRFFDQ